MNRRDFIALVGAALGPLSVGCAAPPSPSWEGLATRAALCFEPATWALIRRVGSAALGSLDVGDEASLERELRPTLTWLEAGEGAAVDCVSRVRNDFRDVEVRNVEGWILSATEVHLAMLMELFELEA